MCGQKFGSLAFDNVEQVMDELVPASPAELVSDKHAPSSADAFDSENR